MKYDFSDEIPAPQAPAITPLPLPAGAGAFRLEPELLDFKPLTVAWVLQRYYEEFRARIGTSQTYTIRTLQNAPNIGPKMALKLTKGNIFEHAKQRLADDIKPQTVIKDFSTLRVALKYAGSAWDDCEGISDVAVAAAMPYMMKHGLVAKGTPRDRLPMADEIALLRNFYREQAKHHNTRLPMELLMDWQIASGRRISETCALIWTDWDFVNQTILVRKMKDPKIKNKRKVVALTNEAQAMLEDMALVMNANPATWADQQPRPFPYLSKSVGENYSRAKDELGIVGLHLHDSRAKCYTSMRERGIPGAIAILVTGHETEATPEHVYKRMKAMDFKVLQNVREATL